MYLTARRLNNKWMHKEAAAGSIARRAALHAVARLVSYQNSTVNRHCQLTTGSVERHIMRSKSRCRRVTKDEQSEAHIKDVVIGFGKTLLWCRRGTETGQLQDSAFRSKRDARARAWQQHHRQPPCTHTDCKGSGKGEIRRDQGRASVENICEKDAANFAQGCAQLDAHRKTRRLLPHRSVLCRLGEPRCR